MILSSGTYQVGYRATGVNRILWAGIRTVVGTSNFSIIRLYVEFL